jgi:dienelactone hydrolase
VSLVGVSFGGGLALVAAGRPSVAARVDQVVSFGGHGDLPRAIRYACTGVLPDGTPQPAHDYGLAILLLQGLPHLVPPEQVAPLEAAVRAFLEASMADGRDQAGADALFARARALAAPLPEPARSIMADVNAREATRLGPRLLALAEVVGGDPALSPERAPLPSARVVLVHGARDNVIPQTETTSLAEFYRARGVRVEALLTPAVSHADPTVQVTARDVWALLRVWVRIQSDSAPERAAR